MYQSNRSGWFKHLDFYIVDILCLELSFMAAYYLRLGFGREFLLGIPLYRNMAAFLAVMDLAVMLAMHSMRDVLKRTHRPEAAITVRQALVLLVLSALYLFSVQDAQAFSRLILYMTFGIYVFFTYACRIFYKRLVRTMMKKSGSRRALVIISTEAMAEKTIRNFYRRNLSQFKITGLILSDRDGSGEELLGVPVVSDMAHAADYVCRDYVDEVLIIPAREYEYPRDLIEVLTETGVVVHLDLQPGEAGGRTHLVEELGDTTVMTVCLRQATALQVFLKRLLDIIGGLVGCLLTGIIYLIIAPKIKKASPGPVFFTQERIGKNGKTFKMYKFRSMYPDAESRLQELMKDNRIEGGLMFKLDFDPRVIGNEILPDGTKKTGIGDLIRRTSLDEFPQFLNVLKGEMSLVGTRPPTVAEFQKYDLHHKARMAVKPGITGMWQVSGRSDITDFEEVVALDTKYINEWSLLLDLKILFKTVAVVFKHEGAM